MHAVKIVAKAGKADCTVAVVGCCDADLPAPVEDLAARIAAGEADAPALVTTETATVLLLKRSDAAWLVGGEDWRQLGAQVTAQLRKAGLASAAVVGLGADADVEAMVEGCLLGDYLFTTHRSGKLAKRKKLTLRFPGQAAAVKSGTAVGAAQNFARTLADAAPNNLYPASFAKRLQQVFADTDISVKLISGVKALAKAGFPGLVTVGMGSAREPVLAELTYTPKGKVAKDSPRLALVGKGITFDTGGISLKPGLKMWEMKGDMGGAAAMAGAMHLIAAQKPKVPVTCYLALAENMPDGKATRPGDIYQARNGTWIHVDNTDAEGRLVLSDVLTYACEQGATHMVDAATLTGAALIGLGMSVAAVMGRHDDWTAAVRDAGQRRGEEIWPLPLYGEYRKQLDHPHADLNNIGGRPAGTITAGIFLSEFVDPEVSWVHVDLAGPAMRTDGWRYYAKGMTGFGVRTFAEVARSLA